MSSQGKSFLFWIILTVISILTIIIIRMLTTKEIWNPNHVWTQRDFETGKKDMITQLFINVVLGKHQGYS